MGTTVTTGRRMGAFSTSAGKTIYVMFEETYAKNCYPHTPRWSCVGIGERNAVIRRIFAIGSDCEGGMLQSRSGHTSPEAYIRSWFSELEAPLEMRDFDINLKVGTGLYSTIQKDKIDEVSGALLSVGREDISCALLLGETVTVSFQKDSAVILALYGLCDGERSLERSLLSPWLVVDSKRMPRIGDDRNARLGYDPKPATAGTAPSTYPVVFRVSGRDECFIQQPDGSLRPAGWSYNIVREFVENLWEEELEYPLTFGRRIKAFRLNVENGRQLPTELFRVIVDTTKPVEHKWEAETIVSFRNEFAGEGAGTVFEFQPTSENFYRVMQLPNAVVRWEFKEDLPPAVPAMSAMQASLF